MKTILAPVDFSVATEGVVAEGTRLAKATGAREVRLSVVQTAHLLPCNQPASGKESTRL